MFITKNIKISVKLEKVDVKSLIEYFQKNNIVFKEKSNYLIVNKLYIYVFFKCKDGFMNHVNVTKIPTFSNVNHAVDYLKYDILINFPIIVKTIFTDNITAVCNMNKNIDLLSLSLKIQNHYQITYNNEKFPGLL